MTLVVYVGGARSGKSTIAVERAEAEGAAVTFIATGEAGDEEMAERIARHRAERPSSWSTVEEPVDLHRAVGSVPARDTIVIDCLSLWIANGGDGTVAHEREGLTIAVTNEVGLGIVPDNALARAYRDELGRVNASWVEAADEAYFVVAGRTLRLA